MGKFRKKHSGAASVGVLQDNLIQTSNFSRAEPNA